MNRGLLATNQQLTRLASRLGQRPFNTIYDTLRSRCSLILECKPVTETDWQAQHARGVWTPALTAARTAQGRIFDLVIAHHIDRNGAYLARAIEELKSLASWSRWLDPSHHYHGLHADLCTAECCATMAVGLDWLYDELSEADRLRCEHALRDKGLAAYQQGLDRGDWWSSCYHNWNAVINAGCGLAALATGDEDPAALHAYHQARKALGGFFDALGREGGWDEGINYWAYAMRYLLLLGEATDRIEDDRSIFRHRGMDNTAAFGVYFSPRGQAAGFGDAGGTPLWGSLYGLVKRYGSREVCWWLDRYGFHRDVSATGWSDAGLALLLRPADIPPEPEPKMTSVKVFNEIGWAAAADRWPEPGMYVSVKTGDLAANHSQLDMNSIQVQVDGEMLLIDPGHPPLNKGYFTDERFKVYHTQARAHNTLVVAEREHAIDGRGQIVEAEQYYGHHWITANAGSALGENVRFNRHVLMTPVGGATGGELLLVIDEVTNAASESVEAFWHTFGQIKLTDKDRAGQLLGRRSKLHFRLAATEPIACAARQHSIATLNESILHVTSGKTQRLVIVSAFGRWPIAPMKIKTSSRGDLSVNSKQFDLHFKGSRRHLQLDQFSLNRQ